MYHINPKNALLVRITGIGDDIGILIDGRFSTVGALREAEKMYKMVHGVKTREETINILMSNGFVSEEEENSTCAGVITEEADCNDCGETISLNIRNGHFDNNIFDFLWVKEAEERVTENHGEFVDDDLPTKGNINHIDKIIPRIKKHENDAYAGDGFFPYAFFRREEDL